MSLIGNYSVIAKSPGRFRSGTSVSSDRSDFNKPGTLANRFTTMLAIAAIPNGYLAPYAWGLPRASGGLASYTVSSGVITPTANLAGGRNLATSTALTMAKSNAQLDQIVSGVGSASLVMAKSSANLAAAALATASRSLAITQGTVICGAIFSVTTAGTMSITPDCDLSALGNMEASAGGPATLSPAGLATSLLDENDIESGFTFRESLRLILASLAGKVSGAGTSTISIRDINDTVDRIVATVDSNGNRTAVTKDVA